MAVPVPPASVLAPTAPEPPAAPTRAESAGPRPPVRRAVAAPAVGTNLDSEVDGLRREVTELRALLEQLRTTLQQRGKSNN